MGERKKDQNDAKLFNDVLLTRATLNVGVTLNASLKQTLFSLKYCSRPSAVSY